MRPKHLLTSLTICLLSSACGTAPKVQVCISDPATGGFDCFDEATQKSSFIAYADSDKFVAFNPTDAQTLLDFCSQGVK